MQDEMDNQDTMISRLNKEKKQLQDSNQKTAEDLQVNFMYSEKAKKFCEMFTLLLTTVHTVKSKVKIFQNFVAFSEYMNFKLHVFWEGHKIWRNLSWFDIYRVKFKFLWPEYINFKT